MSDDLTGRVGLVTGAGGNIGRQVALTLAARGADVAVHVGSDRAAGERVVVEIETLGRRAVVLVADVSRQAEVDSMVASATQELGPIEILVNNAAIRPHRAFVDLTAEDWRRVLGVNLDGPFFLCRAVVPSMIERGRGVIINVGGTASFDGGVRDAHIVASKAGLHGLTKALAVELGGFGIRVNSVIFGTVDTVRKLPASGGPDLGNIPMGRRATMQEAADAVAYLASDRASYITGQAIHVNGGVLLA
jgi:3-oxoacyl-[acyl-carrier protein] reductase